MTSKSNRKSWGSAKLLRLIGSLGLFTQCFFGFWQPLMKTHGPKSFPKEWSTKKRTSQAATRSPSGLFYDNIPEPTEINSITPHTKTNKTENTHLPKRGQDEPPVTPSIFSTIYRDPKNNPHSQPHWLFVVLGPPNLATSPCAPWTRRFDGGSEWISWKSNSHPSSG